MTQRDYIAEIKEVRARLGPVPSRWAQVSARLDNLVDSWHDIQYLRAKNEVINDELLRYFPIGFVACIEGYFRLVYRDLIDFGTPYRENAAQFKDIKLRIEHAVSIQSNSATLGEFITHLLQANSLQDINSNMSVLIGEDYLGRLKRTRFSVLGDRMTLTEKGLEGRLFRDIEGLFRLRHILCHEVVAFEPIDYDEIQVFSLASTTFLLLNESLVKELLVDEN
jgi:hypothetical protein